MSLDPITAGFDFFRTIVDKIFPSKTEVERDKIAQQMAAAAQEAQLMQSQIEVNKVEAASSNLFVAGWRPCVGWICGLSFAWQFLLQPMITYLAVLSGHPVPNLPVFDYQALNTVLFGLLGLGSMRTYEKVKGAAK